MPEVQVNNKKVLIVDDEAMIRLLLKQVLDRLDMKNLSVSVAEDGEEAKGGGSEAVDGSVGGAIAFAREFGDGVGRDGEDWIILGEGPGGVAAVDGTGGGE